MAASTVLHLSAPAKDFANSFLLGNGSMGAAMFCDPANETFMLSHIAFYSGEEDIDAYDPEKPAAFRKAREAAIRGDYAAADENAEKMMGSRENYGTNLPVGRLTITQHLTDISDYHAEMNMADGVAGVSFGHAGGRQTRSCFLSHADRALVLHVKDEAETDVLIRICGENLTAKAEGCEIRFTAEARERLHSDGKSGDKLTGLLQIDAPGGRIAAERDGLHVSGCREWLLTLRMNVQGGSSLTDEVMDETFMRLSDYPALLKRHRADFMPLMERASLEIEGDESAAFAKQCFDLGRYLTVSAAREDGPMAMHLQGVWNDDVACRIGWTCDLHLDINTQMNYWLGDHTGLGDGRKPLFRWMQERLIPHGERAAKNHYGLPGWSGELVSNSHGYAQPYWNRALAPCPGCGAWLALDYMTHYRKTLDRAFLAETAYPALKGCAAFLLAYLTEDKDGYLVGGPSISPENAFFPPNDRHRYNSMGTTFELTVIRALLEDFCECCRLLDRDDDGAGEAIRRLRPLPVNEDGTLGEWAKDFPARDPQHRHMSHLIGLYPLHLLGDEEKAAAKESIRRRITPYENWEDTGWARSMLIGYSARQHDGEAAAFHLTEAKRCLTNENGLVMHPSTRGASSFAPVWELDGNTGTAAGVCEMLMQSHCKVIELLPAIPKTWKKGKFEGLIADGAIHVSAEWNSGKVTVMMKTKEACTVEVFFAEKYVTVELKSDEIPTIICLTDA